MRWILLIFAIVFSISASSEARTPKKVSQAEVRRACRKFLAMSPAKQRAVAKRTKKYTRAQAIWACGVILSRNGTGDARHEPQPSPSEEPRWQCRAEGEVGRQPVSGTGIGDSQATAQAYAISNCGGDCRATSCSESQSGSSSQWTCWAEGYSQSRKETFDGYTENDRSSAERSALSACSFRAKDCSVTSCSNR